MQKKGNLIFLGTGSSDGIPRVSCLTNPEKICKVCESAKNPESKNRRRNTSIAIKTDRNYKQKNIIIDAGKTFWDSAIKFFPKNNIRNIDEIVITHAHADAVVRCVRVSSRSLFLFRHAGTARSRACMRHW